MAGQRTTIKLGSVTAEVSLVKATGEPSGARWETAKLGPDGAEIVEGSGEHVGEPLLIGEAPSAEQLGPQVDGLEFYAPPAAVGGDDPLASVPPSTPIVPPSTGITPIIPATAEQSIQRDQLAGVPTPMSRTARGARTEDGTFIDLTAQLAEIDESVKLDGLQVAAAIPSSAVPRMRTLGAQYVVPQDATSQKVCALLYYALLTEGRGLAVRFSKRTNQALGIVVASSRSKCLVLLEVAWAANERKPPAAAKVADVVENCSDAEIAAAVDYVERLSRPASAIDELEDDRRRLHREVLAAAREGRIDEYLVGPSAEDVVDVDGDLAAAISAGS